MYSKKERIAYAKKTVSDLKDNLDELADNIVIDVERLREFQLTWTKSFHHFSLNNTLLILRQNPKATLVAGRKQWKERYNRSLKKKSQPIHILAPKIIKDKETKEPRLVGFRYVNVYDITQTEGEPIQLGADEYVQGDSIISLEKILKISPVEVVEKDLGAANGCAWSGGIEINEKRKEVSKIKTFIHELAHYHMGHVNRLFSSDLDPRGVEEVEAEAVSYLVSTFLGIEDKRAAYYIGHWGGDKTLLEGRGKKILSVAEKILRQIDEIED